MPIRQPGPDRLIAGSLRSAGACFRPQAGPDPAIASATQRSPARDRLLARRRLAPRPRAELRLVAKAVVRSAEGTTANAIMRGWLRYTVQILGC